MNITKVQKSSTENALFSILIPSWNNLPYLQLAIRSLRTHAHFKHQIIVIINEGKDGTLDWVQQQPDLDYVYSPENLGICLGLNATRKLIQTDFILYINDDMYALPDWDVALKKDIDRFDHSFFTLSATMVEPFDTGNPCVVVQDYGRAIADFKEKELLADFKKIYKTDWQGATWPPNLVPLPLWDLVGGFSVEFSPGMYSDPDFSRKLWEVGVREFKGVGGSLFYHFGSKSTRRIRHNKGKRRFLFKWGISANDFTSTILKRGTPYNGSLPDQKMTTISGKLKQLWALIKK